MSETHNKQPATSTDFERILDELCTQLTNESKKKPHASSAQFENRVREVLKELIAPLNLAIDLTPRAYVFPDIVAGAFGVEVKFTTNDTWRSVANSVFESTKDKNVEHIYVVFGKMGGVPEVQWDRYDNCVTHVRTSHVPRFEIHIKTKKSLFAKMKITYAEFSKLPMSEKMAYIRKYAREKNPGRRFWWIEDNENDEHTLPIEAQIYMTLPPKEKRRFRAEAALLCPEIVKPPGDRHKYYNAALFLLTYHGILCPQARDLFSAGSVAMRESSKRGGNYVLRALQDIESEMREAARTMNDALFVEYWGESVPPENRIREWLRRADKLAETWEQKLSQCLFIGGK